MGEAANAGSMALARLVGEDAPAALALALAAMGSLLAVGAASLALGAASGGPGASAPAGTPSVAVEAPRPVGSASVANAQQAGTLPPCPQAVTVVFDSGSATPLADGAGPGIARLIDWLDRHPRAKVEVEGHADTLGSDQPNLLLSYQRAKAVAALLGKSGAPAQRILIVAAGSQQPLEGVPGNAQANRRAILRISDTAGCLSAFTER